MSSLLSSSVPLPSILSYNVNSLSAYSSAIPRRSHISSALKDFIKTHDILCIQESHLKRHDHSDDCKGYVQLRRYISSDARRASFQIFNVYLKSGHSSAFNELLLSAMLSVDSSFICGR